MTSPALTAVLAVQDLDTALDQARHRLSHLPERAALEQVHAERAAVARRAADATAARDEVAGRQAALEAELAAAEQRRAVIAGRMYGGTVSSSRDLQAMAAESDQLAARVSSLEDGILAALEEREPHDAAVAAADAEDAALAGREAGLAEQLATAAGGVEEEIDALVARRAEAAAAVPADLLATYERLRTRLGGVGAARLVGDHCAGCHLALPATELERVRRADEGTVAFCDQCGRILVAA